jgi:hypothetical protein
MALGVNIKLNEIGHCDETSKARSGLMEAFEAVHDIQYTHHQTFEGENNYGHYDY